MRDAKEHLRPLDLLDAPDLWEEAVSYRLASPHPEPADPGGRVPQRLLAAFVAFVAFGGATMFLVRAFDTPVDRPDSSPSMTASPEARGVWQPLPAPPIPFRQGAIGIWVDGRVVIIGGSETAPTCPRDLICDGGLAGPTPRDGAAYDPSTGTWTRIAASPLAIIPYTWAVIGDVVYIWGSTNGYSETNLLAFDVNEDRWSELPFPPGPHRPTALKLASAGEMLVAFADSQERGVTPDALFDPSTGRWRELPRDPLIPSFDRSIVWTGSELVLIGTESQPPEVATYEDRVATFDIASGTWRRLTDSITEGNPNWFWAAGRVVNPEIGHVGDSGSIEGSGPPYGGIFDPSTGEWAELPEDPERMVPYGGPSVGGDRYVVTDQGAILDVATGSWEGLPATPLRADEQAVAVWAGDRLIVWGGYRWERSSDEAEMVDAGWSWIPSG
jgi:hypothetical protein